MRHSYEYYTFEKRFVEVLEKYAPEKRKILRNSPSTPLVKKKRTIILTHLYLFYFWKRFTDDIFFILLGSHSQLKPLMTFMNTISPTIKYTFTYSEQTVSFLDVKIYLSESRKLKTKLYKKPTDCMTLPLSPSTQLQLRYHLFPSYLGNLDLLSQRTPQSETNILTIATPFSELGKLFTATIHKNWHTIANDTTQPSCPLCTNIWLPTTGTLTLLPIHTHIHYYRHTHRYASF